MRGQHGIAMVLVLIFLGAGGILLAPTLRHIATALNFYGISRESAEVEYALDAVTQQALWLLENGDPFQECDSTKAGVDSFAECVGFHGSWDLATADKLESKVNESEIEPINGQQVEVTVKVPAPLGAAVDPTPTPTSGACFYAWVSRDPTWVLVGQPIEYTLHVWNCSTSPSQKHLRFVAVITDPLMSYVAGSKGGNMVSPPIEPEVGDCQAPDDHTELAACPGYVADSLLLSWPTAATPFGDEAGTQPSVKMQGGEKGNLVFKLEPQGFGIFYVDVLLCYFNESNPCKADSSQTTGKVAPVIAGMFNIQGQGKGHAYGASSKLDSGGSDLISEQPQ